MKNNSVNLWAELSKHASQWLNYFEKSDNYYRFKLEYFWFLCLFITKTEHGDLQHQSVGRPALGRGSDSVRVCTVTSRCHPLPPSLYLHGSGKIWNWLQTMQYIYVILFWKSNKSGKLLFICTHVIVKCNFLQQLN